VRRGVCAFPPDLDYSGYSDRALREARSLWSYERNEGGFDGSRAVPGDHDLVSRKIAAIDAEIARRRDAIAENDRIERTMGRITP